MFYNVADLKRFEEQPKSLKVHLGDNAMFACDIKGSPKPTVRWYKEEREIVESENINYRLHQDGVLEISNVQFADLGRYKCKAESVDKSRTSEVATLIQNDDLGKYLFVS